MDKLSAPQRLANGYRSNCTAVYGSGESGLGMDPWGVTESNWKFQSKGGNPLAWDKSFLKNTFYPMLLVHVSNLAKRSTKME